MAGAFYGYLMELAWNAGFFAENVDSPYGTTQRSGHLGLNKVLHAPQVDFLVSPYSYGFRGIGGYGAAMPPSESMRRHGKLFIFEDDTRTHLAPPDAGFGRAASPDDSEAILKRNFAEVVTRGYGIWWLGNPGHIDPVRAPAFGPLLARFQELGTFALSLDRAPSAEIAMLVDDESYYYESLRSDLDLALISQQRLWGIPRLGAPTDTYLLQDLIDGNLPPYKLYILLNAFHLDEARRAALLRQLKRDGRTALWLYAPGYIDEAPGLDSMAALTGFSFGRGDHAWIQTMHLTNFDHPITAGLPQDLSWETGAKVGPQFHLEDDEATILGENVYAQGRCRPGFGVKVFSGVDLRLQRRPEPPGAGAARHRARRGRPPLQRGRRRALRVTPAFRGAHRLGRPAHVRPASPRRGGLRSLRAANGRREHVRDQGDTAAAIDGAVLYGGCRASESRIQRSGADDTGEIPPSGYAHAVRGDPEGEKSPCQ